MPYSLGLIEDTLVPGARYKPALGSAAGVLYLAAGDIHVEGDGGAGLGGEMRAAGLERAGRGAALDAKVSSGQVEHARGRGERGLVARAGAERVFDQPQRVGHRNSIRELTRPPERP